MKRSRQILDPGPDAPYAGDQPESTAALRRMTRTSLDPTAEAEVRDAIANLPSQELRTQAILRLIRSGAVRTDDPVLDEIARDFGVLRRRERATAVAGALGRTLTGGLGPLIGTDTSAAARKIPLTPRESYDQSAEDRKTALEAYKATAPTAHNFFKIDQENIKVVREGVENLLEQIISRAGTIEKGKYDAMAKASELRKDFGVEQIKAMIEFNKLKYGERTTPRTDKELLGALDKYLLKINDIPVDMREGAAGLAMMINAVTNNTEEARNLAQELAKIARDSTDPLNEKLRQASTEWDDNTSIDALVKDLTDEGDAGSVISIVLRGKENANRIGAMDDETLLRALATGKYEIDPLHLAKFPGENDEERMQFFKDLAKNYRTYQVEYMNLMDDPKALEAWTNNLMREAVKVGYNPVDLADVSETVAKAMGYESIADYRNQLQSYAIDTKKIEDAAVGTQERLGTFADKMFERPRPQRTREFKEELLRPENAEKLAKLDAYAKQTGLSRDDALSALSTQMFRDKARRRQATPGVLQELAKGKSVAAVRAQKAVKPASQTITRKSAKGPANLPLGDLGAGAVEKKDGTEKEREAKMSLIDRY